MALECRDHLRPNQHALDSSGVRNQNSRGRSRCVWFPFCLSRSGKQNGARFANDRLCVAATTQAKPRGDGVERLVLPPISGGQTELLGLQRAFVG